jgi:hypothetical protein
MSNSNAEKNKAIVLKAFDTLFNKRDYQKAEPFSTRDRLSCDRIFAGCWSAGSAACRVVG